MAESPTLQFSGNVINGFTLDLKIFDKEKWELSDQP